MAHKALTQGGSRHGTASGNSRSTRPAALGRRLFLLLALALLLAGCGGEAPRETEPAQPQGYYRPDTALESGTGGGVRVYPLEDLPATGMRAWGEDLLILSGNTRTTLTLLRGQTLYPAAQTELDCVLEPEDPSLVLLNDGLSYYDSRAGETVVLDRELTPTRRIQSPEGLSGSPILSRDGNRLYYCTAEAVMVWDFGTGIRRQIRQSALPGQTLAGLFREDELLWLTAGEGADRRNILLRTDTGAAEYTRNGQLTLAFGEAGYYADYPTGATRAMAFGDGTQTQALTPRDLWARCVFLPRSHAAVTVTQGQTLTLDYYDLATGRRCSSLTLPGQEAPAAAVSAGAEAVYVLARSDDWNAMTIYRWQVLGENALAVADQTCYTGPFYTAQAPDYEGLERCRNQAARISRRFGLEVLVWEDAMAVQPWDYDFQAEYLVPVLEQELASLEQRLENYPKTVLEQTASHFAGVKICLVRRLTGSAEAGSLDVATGIQFFEEDYAYIALAVGPTSEKGLYHELYHVMQTHLLTHSTVLDQWEDLNPPGFFYDYDYVANAERYGGVFLEEENRAFVDTYSMSYPKEDQARILENAMTAGNADLFQTPVMAKKLQTLCQSIRQAYGLEDDPETYLWEQYLSP